MKNRRKKELAEEKKQRMATGGGSYVPPPQDHQTDDILSNIDIEITDTVDSDAIVLVEGIPQQSIACADENLETEEGKINIKYVDLQEIVGLYCVLFLEIHIVVEKGTPSRSRSEGIGPNE
ncbi:hypothetical protein MML48_4g00007076 [Holotrichia oblita]|uniref:Uncharacterized protein n=1 Tax=Holotrichia oblita TaxID=644536 RepID=A0ACB9T8U7_HOLOL|nr:hypothetical protein MML48_4g00007076 [Holotrichia oblita]